VVVVDEIIEVVEVVAALADVDGTVDDSMVVLVAVLNVAALDVVAATSAGDELTVVAPLGVATVDGSHAARPTIAIAENETPTRHRLTPSVNP